MRRRKILFTFNSRHAEALWVGFVQQGDSMTISTPTEVIRRGSATLTGRGVPPTNPVCITQTYCQLANQL